VKVRVGRTDCQGVIDVIYFDNITEEDAGACSGTFFVDVVEYYTRGIDDFYSTVDLDRLEFFGPTCFCCDCADLIQMNIISSKERRNTPLTVSVN